jgi:hypothetical protein
VTAANLIVRGAEAHLLTDSAALSADGIVTNLDPKVVANRRLRLVIARNGLWWQTAGPTTRSWLDEQPDEDAAIEALPELMARLRADALSRYEPHPFNLFVAAWSPSRGRAEGYIIASEADGFAPGVEAGKAYLTGDYICPKVDRTFYPPLDASNWSPLPLLEAQRARLNPKGRYTVGGIALLTTVSEAGVSLHPLKQWPDEIGRPIDPLLERTGALSGDSWANPKESARTATGL